MKHKESATNTIPEKIINTYYQKFYQGKKTSVLGSPLSKFTTFVLKKSKQNGVVFQINYETSKRRRSDQKSSNTQFLNKSTSKSSLRNQAQLFTENNQSASPHLNNNLLFDHMSVNIPKKNITFEVSNKKNVKVSVKQIKSDPNRHQFNAPNFENFLEENKNSKKKNLVNHFLKVNPYSKAVDFVQNVSNPQKELKYLHSSLEVSPDKKDEFFTLQSFSHIQVHRNKKISCPSKFKQVYDIVKRKQVNLSPTHNSMRSSIVMQSEANKERHKMAQVAVEKVKAKQRIITPSGIKNNRQGLFKQFKPKVELKRRPSTGIPLRKNRYNVVNSALDQHKTIADSNRYHNPSERITNFFNTVDTSDMRNFTASRNHHTRKHSRATPVDFNSPRELIIDSKQIHLQKYFDLSQTDKISQYFKNSKDLGQKELNNLVNLEFRRKRNQRKLNRYSGKKHKNIKKQQQFQPWESVNRGEEIQNDEFIKRQIQMEIFSKSQMD